MKEEQKEYYSLPLEECLERMSESLEMQGLLRFLIQENADKDESWESDLMLLLTEYYSIVTRYIELINELILTPAHVVEETDEELIYVDGQKYNIMLSYSKLMLVDEFELKHHHRINLIIQ
tara:strand:+ start:337 stop:699 length:363 start_codon:yes stop_codon:yes gene_type:complete